MRIPDPRNYDFLWLVHNMTYFQTSFWLHPGYLKRDFIITFKDNQWKTYIGKKERKRLSRTGLNFLSRRLSNYRIKVKEKISEAKKLFSKIKTRNLSRISNLELCQDFLDTIKFIQKLWQLYFFTEYFLYDGVQEKIAKNPKRTKSLQKAVKEVQKIKFRLRTILNKTIFRKNIFEKYLKEIERRTRRKDLDYLSYEEIGDLLKGKRVKKINRKIYVLGKFNQWKPILGKKAKKIIEVFESYIKKQTVLELKGEIANPGHYIGRVKIIPFDLKKNISREIAKMHKGDILVTGSTGPEMTLAFKKAGAIITEEGGICSHAALVAREFKLPCIIGTKIATQILKDGDQIEVDAGKGIVKVLKRV